MTTCTVWIFFIQNSMVIVIERHALLTAQNRAARIRLYLNLNKFYFGIWHRCTQHIACTEYLRKYIKIRSVSITRFCMLCCTSKSINAVAFKWQVKFFVSLNSWYLQMVRYLTTISTRMMQQRAYWPCIQILLHILRSTIPSLITGCLEKLVKNVALNP